jgi:hypothetical protein
MTDTNPTFHVVATVSRDFNHLPRGNVTDVHTPSLRANTEVRIDVPHDRDSLTLDSIESLTTIVKNEVNRSMAFGGSAYSNVTGLTSNLIIDGDGLLSYSLRGLRGLSIASLQPLAVISAAETVIQRFLDCGARLRVLFRSSYDLPVSLIQEQQQFGMLRDLLRFHLLLHVDQRNSPLCKVIIDDHDYQVQRGLFSGFKVRRAEHSVENAFKDGSTVFRNYLREVKPSAFMFDLKKRHHHGPLFESDRSLALASLSEAEALYVLVKLRLPVVDMWGNTELGRIEWARNRSLATVQWPFSAAVDSVGEVTPTVTRSSSDSSSFPVSSRRSEADGAFHAASLLSSKLDSLRTDSLSVDREAVVNAVLKVVKTFSPEALKVGGWAFVISTAAAVLLETSLSQLSFKSLESFVVHAALLSILPIQRRAFDDDVLDNVGASMDEFADVIPGIEISIRHVSRWLVSTIATRTSEDMFCSSGGSPLDIIKTHHDGFVDSNSSSTDLTETKLCALLTTLPSGRICDVIDVRLWRLVHVHIGMATDSNARNSLLPVQMLEAFHLLRSPNHPSFDIHIDTRPHLEDKLTHAKSDMAKIANLCSQPPILPRLPGVSNTDSFVTRTFGNKMMPFEIFSESELSIIPNSVPFVLGEGFNRHWHNLSPLGRRPKEILRLRDALDINSAELETTIKAFKDVNDEKKIVNEKDVRRIARSFVRNKDKYQHREANMRDFISKSMAGEIIQRDQISVIPPEASTGNKEAVLTRIRKLNPFGEKKSLNLTTRFSSDIMRKNQLEARDSIIRDCQHLKHSHLDSRLKLDIRKPDENIELLNDINKDKNKKSQFLDEYAKTLQSAQDRWDKEVMMDLIDDLFLLGDRFSAFKVSDPDNVRANLYNSAESFLRRYWPSFWMFLQKQDGGRQREALFPSSAADTVNRLKTVLSLSKSEAVSLRDSLLIPLSSDGKKMQLNARDLVLKVDLKKVIQSKLLDILVVVIPSRAIAAATSIAFAYLLCASDSSFKDVRDYLIQFWTKLERENCTWANDTYLRWQLQAIPEYLLRPKGNSDARAKRFRPDDWQVELLNVIDDPKKSALVSVPTSAGKTFICFYAMEKVLRGSNDGICVYVCPTKALCDQVSADIHSRFSKDYNSSNSCLIGLFVADRRYDEMRSQILICVPQTLEILLLASHQGGWSRRIQRIIFDEVHNAILSEGEVWERLLLYAAAPILALSATIGDFSRFSSWLQGVESKRRHELNIIPNDNIGPISRFNDIETFLFEPPSSPMALTDLTRIHPVGALHIGLLGQGKRRADIHLLPEESLQLFDALSHQIAANPSSSDLNESFHKLSPSMYFGSPAMRIVMTDAHSWGRELLQFLDKLADTDSLSAQSVLRELKGSIVDILERVDQSVISSGQKSYLFSHVSSLVQSMKKKRLLPAIVFHLDTRGCSKLASVLSLQLILAERNERLNRESQGKDLEKKKRLDECEKDLKVALSYADKSRKNRADDDAADANQEEQNHISSLRRKIAKLESDLNPIPGVPLSSKFTLCDTDFGDPDPPSLHDIISILAGTEDSADYNYQKKKDELIVKLKREQDRLASDLLIFDESVTGATASGATPLSFPVVHYLKWSNLLRGVGVHHSQVEREYKTVVQLLCHAKRLRVIFATSTLAQGINMPARSVVFAGDSSYLDSVIFQQCQGRAGRRGFDTRGSAIIFGMPSQRALFFLSAALPSMTPTSPVSASYLLRLLIRFDSIKRINYYNSKDDQLRPVDFEDVDLSNPRTRPMVEVRDELLEIVESGKRVLQDNLLENNDAFGLIDRKMQLLNARFFLSLLHSLHILDDCLRPTLLAGVPAYLHYHEPANFVFVKLLLSNAVNRLILDVSEGWDGTGIMPEAYVLLHRYDVRGNVNSVFRSFDREVTTSTFRRDVGLLSLLTILLNHEPLEKAVGPKLKLKMFPKYVQRCISAYNKTVLSSFEQHLRVFVNLSGSSDFPSLPSNATLPVSSISWPSDEANEARDVLQPECGLATETLSLSRKLITRSAFSAIVGVERDTLSDKAMSQNRLDGLRPGLNVDSSSIPVVNNIAVSPYCVELYLHGDWERIKNIYEVDDGYQFNQISKFIQGVKACTVQVLLRWWTYWCDVMMKPKLVPWMKRGRWEDPENFDADIQFVIQDRNDRERELRLKGSLQDKVMIDEFVSDANNLIAELPVVQAFRGLSFRFATVARHVTRHKEFQKMKAKMERGCMKMRMSDNLCFHGEIYDLFRTATQTAANNSEAARRQRLATSHESDNTETPVMTPLVTSHSAATTSQRPTTYEEALLVVNDDDFEDNDNVEDVVSEWIGWNEVGVDQENEFDDAEEEEEGEEDDDESDY